MLQVVGFGFTLLLAVIGGVVWNVRLEGRVNGHDSLFIEREKQHNDRYEEIIRRLDRIEKKQDDANGHRRVN
jgi:hypothetical protein